MTTIGKISDVAKALAGFVGATDLVKLLTDPATQQSAVNTLTRDKLVPDPRKLMPKDLKTAGKLLPIYRAIDFTLRDDEMRDYTDWAADATTSLAVRLITGGSGRGKTRLMIEMAGKLRDDGLVLTGHTKANWTAGFVDLPALQTAVGQIGSDPYAVPFAAQDNLFLVVDYAETKPDEVTQLLKAALAAADDDRTGLIRIVLIARQQTEIFDKIFQDSVLADRALVEIHPDALKPVTDPKAFFQQACECLDVPDTARTFPAKLKLLTPDFGLLSLTALLAATGKTAINDDAEKILDRVLTHEQSYWKQAAKQHNVPDILMGTVKTVAAHLTLFGLQGAIENIEAGAELIKIIPQLADQDYANRRALVTAIADCYPQPDGRIEGVGLDLLGDHLVANASADLCFDDKLSGDHIRSALTRITWIARRGGAAAQAIINRLLSADHERGLTIIIAQAPAIGDPLGQLAAAWLENKPIDPELALQLSDKLPDDSLSLREFSTELTQNALLNIDDPEQRARLLNNLAVRLSALGRPEQALTAAQELSLIHI